MSARILEGAPVAQRIKTDVAERVNDIKGRLEPKLVALMVGDNAGAKAYARSQARACEEVGIGYELKQMSPETTEAQLIGEIAALNADPTATAIILTMPVPAHINGRAAQRMISPTKDVDGVHPVNLGGVVQGRRVLAPCTAMAVMEVLEDAGVKLEGAEAVVVGHSEIVGKPTALFLMEAFATTTVCHIATRDLAAHTKKAEVLVVGVGKAGLVDGSMILPGATVVDIGINRVPNPETGKSKIVGDVDFASAVEVAGAITPVPGGVGMVTTAILLRNAIEAAELQVRLEQR